MIARGCGSRPRQDADPEHQNYQSGVVAGIADGLGQQLPGIATLWGDGLLEARQPGRWASRKLDVLLVALHLGHG